MGTVSVRIHQVIMDKLRRYHLSGNKRKESLSYIWGQAVKTKGGIVILVPHNAPLFLFAPDCYENQTSGNVRLNPDVLNGMLIKFAASSFNCLINVHDHWFDEYTRFSMIDNQDDIIFDRYLKKTFEPMLAKHPHIGKKRKIFNLSIVLAQKGIDARLVNTRAKSKFQTVTSLTVVGNTYERMNVGRLDQNSRIKNMYHRQKAFVSHDDQILLRDLNVAVIGCGGLGSVLAESLGRVGFGGVTLIDDDSIEASNLNRWQGGTPGNIGKNKASTLGGRMRRMFPDMCVKYAKKSVFDPSIEPILSTCDVIVAGLDNDEARYFLNRFSIQYGVPYFDAGVSVSGITEGVDFHLRYFSVLPGETACIECSQYSLFDREKTLNAFMSEITMKSKRSAGYVVDNPDIETPSVYVLNLRSASVLVTELLNYICGWRPPATVIYESWREGNIQRCDRGNFPEGPDPECPICGYFAGVGDTEALPRPRDSHFSTGSLETISLEVKHG